MKKFTTLLKYGLFVSCLLMGLRGLSQTNIYNNLIPIPPLLDGPTGVTTFLNVKESTHNFDPASGTTTLNPFRNVPTWTFSQQGAGDTTTYLGPTLHWWSGDIADTWSTNALASDTFTTIHWHGLELPARDDGGPHEWIASGDTNIVTFPVLDSASTNWYHPHLHDNTFGQVEKGLSGMIIIDQFQDSINDKLPRTYGIDDIPLIIQDKGFTLNGTTYNINTTKGGKRPWNIVNGVIHPYVEVPVGMIRFRILNGSSRKGMRFALTEDSTGNSYIPFWLVATDGGYTMSPEQMTVHTIGPGERIEIVMDFTQANLSQTFYLRNLASSMPSYIVGASVPGPNGGGGDVTNGTAFLAIKFKSNPSGFTPVTTAPSWNRNWAALDLDNTGIDQYRNKYLVPASGGGYLIADGPDSTTGTTFEMSVVNDVVCEGSKEQWTVVNKSNVAHPFHIHKVIIRVVSIDSAGTSIPIAERGFDGPKDDVLVYPNWRMSFIAVFDDYGTPGGLTDTANAYMYHCHILTHEDAEGGGMMHQFVVSSDQPCLPHGVSVKDGTEGLDVDIYPNPARDELYIKGSSKVAGTLQVYDLMGRLLAEDVLRPFEGTVRIDAGKLPRGLVMVQYRTSKGSFSEKVLLY
jgi:FtsP/CotA-like multicopper oxidase with cupredoxin domain